MQTTIATAEKRPDVRQLMAKVGDKKLTFGQWLNSVRGVMEACQEQMLAALPAHVTPDHMMRVALNCIGKTPKLLECTPQSLFGAITEAATYGWELGGVLGHAYLVPFGQECQLIPGYKGLLDLARRWGNVSTVALEVVHDGDAFDYALGDTPYIRHVPDDENPERDGKPITHVYAVVRLRDGGVQRSVWSKPRIERHKEQYSTAWRRAEVGKKDSAWHTAWPTMAKKTVLRDMINRDLIPLSVEHQAVAKRAGDEVIDATMRPAHTPALPLAQIVPAAMLPPQVANDEPKPSPLDHHDELTACDAIGKVNALREQHEATFDGGDLETWQKLCDARIDDIRATRGERSGAAQQTTVEPAEDEIDIPF